MERKILSPVFDLSQSYGLITVCGEKAATFLQGQLSNDIYAIKPGSYQWNAYCNLKGRIHALLKVWLNQDHYCLLLPRSILAQTLNVLKQYGRFSKITIEDKSADYSITGLVQPDEEILSSLAAEGMQLLKLPDAIPRFICIGPNPLPLSNVGAGIEAGPAEWQALDIRAGIPEIFPQTVELFLPHHVGLTALGAISFSKGCFCGQEVIARMEYRSTPKRGLAYAQCDAYEGPLPTPGTLIYEDPQSAHSIGTVVNATQLETLEMLIEIQKDKAQDEHLILRADTNRSRADTEVGPYKLHSKIVFF